MTNRIDERCKALGITRNVLAARMADLRKTSVSGYENVLTHLIGDNAMMPSSVALIARASECTADYLLGISDDPNHPDYQQLEEKLQDALGQLTQLRADHEAAGKAHAATVAELEERNNELDSRLTAMRIALTEAGIPESEPYPNEPVSDREKSLRTGGRMLGGVERIEMLAAKVSKPAPIPDALKLTEGERAKLSAFSCHCDGIDLEQCAFVESLIAARVLKPMTEAEVGERWNKLPTQSHGYARAAWSEMNAVVHERVTRLVNACRVGIAPIVEHPSRHHVNGMLDAIQAGNQELFAYHLEECRLHFGRTGDTVTPNIAFRISDELSEEEVGQRWDYLTRSMSHSLSWDEYTEDARKEITRLVNHCRPLRVPAGALPLTSNDGLDWVQRYEALRAERDALLARVNVVTPGAEMTEEEKAALSRLLVNCRFSNVGTFDEKREAIYQHVASLRAPLVSEVERLKLTCSNYAADLAAMAKLAGVRDDEYPRKAVERALSELTQARADLLEVARATGIVYEPEGHAPQPGPTKLVVRQRLQEIVDEWRTWGEQLSGLCGERNKIQARIAQVYIEHGELQVRLQNLIDEHLGTRETTPLAGLVGILERELSGLCDDNERLRTENNILRNSHNADAVKANHELDNIALLLEPVRRTGEHHRDTIERLVRERGVAAEPTEEEFAEWADVAMGYNSTTEFLPRWRSLPEARRTCYEHAFRAARAGVRPRLRELSDNELGLAFAGAVEALQEELGLKATVASLVLAFSRPFARAIIAAAQEPAK